VVTESVFDALLWYQQFLSRSPAFSAATNGLGQASVQQKAASQRYRLDSTTVDMTI
jgi:hypothetical protein